MYALYQITWGWLSTLWGMGIPLIHFVFLLGQMTLFFPQNLFSPNLFKRVEVAAEQPLGNNASHVSCITSVHHCTHRLKFVLQQPRCTLAHVQRRWVNSHCNADAQKGEPNGGIEAVDEQMTERQRGDRCKQWGDLMFHSHQSLRSILMHILVQKIVHLY